MLVTQGFYELLVEYNFLKLNYDLFVFPLLHFIHVGWEGVHHLVPIQVESELSLSNLPEVSDFETIPTIGFGLISHLGFVFLSCNHEQIKLSLVFVVDVLDIFRHIETFVKSDGSELVEFVFKVRTGVVSVIVVVDCIEFVFHN